MPHVPAQKAETRRRIVDSARKLFNRRGFSDVSIDEVMAEAGLTRGGFYKHFASKEDLYAHAVRQFNASPRRPAWQTRNIDPAARGRSLAAMIVNAYLSRDHLDDRDGSCPMIGLPSDVARGSAVTKKAFIAQLQAVPYDVLVYLGHGSLEELIPGSQPTSALLFEKAGGENADDHDPMDAAQLNGVFKSLPAKVPVVLLTGCLTAAETPNEKEQYLEKLALQRLRGSQAIAQALVNSPDTGVQLVVGMRYRLEASAAMTFLEGFFQGLLQRHPGNVEAAVRTGREALFQEAVHPPQWSAPVVFRTLAPEPFFDFMTRPPAGATVTAAPRPAATNGFGLAAASTGPAAPVGPSGGDGSGNLAGPGPTQDTIVPGWLPSPTEERDLLYRTVAWDALVQQPVSMRTAGSLQFPTQILEQSEQRLRQRGLADGVVLMPERVEVQHDQPAVVTVRLYGAAFVDWVNGRVVSSSDALKIDSVEPTPALTAAGFQLLTGRVSATSTSFRIQRSQEDGGGILPESLLLVNLRAGPEFPVVNTVRADFLSMSQVRPVYPIDNAVIVPAP